MADSDELDDPDYLLSAVKAFREGLSGISAGIVLLIRGFWKWSNDHPIIRWIVIPIASGIIFKIFLRLSGRLYNFFYGQTVPISNDIILGTLGPFPVGLTIYLLGTVWIISMVVVLVKILELRERINELESIE